MSFEKYGVPERIIEGETKDSNGKKIKKNFIEVAKQIDEVLKEEKKNED